MELGFLLAPSISKQILLFTLKSGYVFILDYLGQSIQKKNRRLVDNEPAYFIIEMDIGIWIKS